MFNRTTTESSNLQKAIDDVLTHMESYPPHSEEYVTAMDQLVKLHEMKTTESPRRISPDTLATVAANLIGIVLIVNHEYTHVLTTKALGFLPKLSSN